MSNPKWGDPFPWEDTFPKEKFTRSITLKETYEQVCFSNARVRVLIKEKDTTIYAKKAQIVCLQKELDDLKERYEKKVKKKRGPYIKNLRSRQIIWKFRRLSAGPNIHRQPLTTGGM